jgi:hypothetical protein
MVRSLWGLHVKLFAQNPPYRLRLARLRVRLLRDPGVQGLLDVRVEADPDDGADAGAGAAALVFLAVSYCARPRLMLTETDQVEPERGGTPAPVLTTTRLVR